MIHPARPGLRGPVAAFDAACVEWHALGVAHAAMCELIAPAIRRTNRVGALLLLGEQDVDPDAPTLAWENDVDHLAVSPHLVADRLSAKPVPDGAAEVNLGGLFRHGLPHPGEAA